MLYAVIGVIALDWIGFGILLPTFPFFAESYGANGMVWGALLSVHALMQLLCAPMWGKLSDRIGRKPVLTATICGGAFGLLLLAWADSLLWMFIARIISGICAANMSVATAYIADVTDADERTSAMGMAGAAVGIGFVLGPAIGALLVDYGFTVPIYVAAALFVVNAIQVQLRVQEPKQREQRPALSLREVLSDVELARLVLLNFLLVMGITQLETAVPLYLEHVYHFVPRQVGYCFVLIAMVMVVMQGGVVRRLKHISERTLIILGAALLAMSLSVIPLGWTWGWVVLLLGVGAAGRGLVQPALLSLTSKLSKQGHYGHTMGVFHAAASLARCAPFIAGVLYDHDPGMPFFVGAALIIAVAGFATRIRGMQREI